MSYHPDADDLEFGRAATSMAIAYADVADARDRLISLGRELRDTDAARHMPSDDEISRALHATGDLHMARLHLVNAEENYERQRERVRGPMP